MHQSTDGCLVCASRLSLGWFSLKTYQLRKQERELIPIDWSPCPSLDLSKTSKFVLTEHGSLLFGTAFCNGSRICHIAISRSCTIAIIELHASLCQLTFTRFTVRQCFREHCYLFADGSSRGGGSSMAQSKGWALLITVIILWVLSEYWKLSSAILLSTLKIQSKGQISTSINYENVSWAWQVKFYFPCSPILWT